MDLRVPDVERGQDDGPRVALATCSRCYRYRRPHYALKGKMMCGMCNSPMRLPDSHGGTQVACSLVAVPFERHKNEIVVRASAVAQQWAEVAAVSR